MRVHYHQGEETAAERAAALGERALARVETEIGWRVRGTVQLVLLDDFDIANGWATPLPYNLTTIYLPAPGPDNLLSNYDDWLHLVITHEVTHIVHLDMAIGPPRVVRAIFGRTPMGLSVFLPTAFPNLAQPVWLIEGYGAYLETKLTAGGRGRNSSVDMMLRTAVLENKLPSLPQLTDWQTSWPGGHLRYIYGGSLYEMLAEKIKPDAPARIARKNAAALFPQFHVNSAPESFGWSYKRLYALWKKRATAKAETQAAIVKKSPLTQATQITRSGFETRNPVFLPDGDRILYVDHNAHRTPGLRLMNRDGTGDRVLMEGEIQGDAAVSPDGAEVIVSKLDFFKTHSLRSDLYRLRLRDGKVTRLTKGGRAMEPAWSPDGRRVAYVKWNGERTDLFSMDLATGDSVQLNAPVEETDQLRQPHWSPDGKKIAYAVWRRGEWNIETLSLEDGRVEKITADAAVDSAPAWTPDGRWIAFTSDRGGVSNVHAFSTESRKTFRVTNVLSGAFDPAPAPNGAEIAYAAYSSKGYDITIASFQPVAATAFDIRASSVSPARVEDPAPVPFTRHRYNPIPTLLPRFWIPNFGGGVYVGGLDALMEHYYFAGTYAGADFDFNYINQQLFPYIEAYAWNFKKTAYGTGFPFWQNSGIATQGNALSVWFPFQKILSYQMIKIGVVEGTADYERARRENRHVPPNPPERFKGGTVGYQFSNARQPGFAVAPESGRSLTTEHFSQGKASGADDAFSYTRFAWNEYFRGWGRHHAVEIGAGTSLGDKPYINSFRNSPLTTAPIKERSRAGFLSKTKPGMDTGILPPISKPDDGFFSKMGEVHAAYAFPILTVERGVGNGFYFLDRIHGQVFAAGDRYWEGNRADPDWRSFGGAELSTDWGLSYFVPLRISVDAQRQFDAADTWDVHVRLSINSRI